MDKLIKKINIIELIISIALAQAAGIIGSLFTFSGIKNWYAFLEKPFWSPPNWIFGPVWITLFTLMGIASYMIWQRKNVPDAKPVLKLYGLHLIVNALWSILFFGLRSPLLALVDIVILLALIVIIMSRFYKIYKPSGFILIPYLAWVSFASILNAAILCLN